VLPADVRVATRFRGRWTAWTARVTLVASNYVNGGVGEEARWYRRLETDRCKGNSAAVGVP